MLPGWVRKAKRQWHARNAGVSKAFIQNAGFRIKDAGFYIYNDEVCTKDDAFWKELEPGLAAIAAFFDQKAAEAKQRTK